MDHKSQQLFRNIFLKLNFNYACQLIKRRLDHIKPKKRAYNYKVGGWRSTCIPIFWTICSFAQPLFLEEMKECAKEQFQAIHLSFF